MTTYPGNERAALDHGHGSRPPQASGDERAMTAPTRAAPAAAVAH